MVPYACFPSRRYSTQGMRAHGALRGAPAVGPSASHVGNGKRDIAACLARSPRSMTSAVVLASLWPTKSNLPTTSLTLVGNYASSLGAFVPPVRHPALYPLDN